MNTQMESPLWELTSRQGSRRGASWPILTQPLLIGRARHCHIVIQDPAVSREHCRLFSAGERVFLEHLSVRSATLVNGHAVRRAELRLEDTVCIGTATFVLTRAAEVDPDHPCKLTQKTTIHPLHPAPAQTHGGAEEFTPGPRSVFDLGVLHDFVLLLSRLSEEAEIAGALLQTLSEQVEARCWLLCLEKGRNGTRAYPREDLEAVLQDSHWRECVASGQLVSAQSPTGAPQDPSRIRSYIPLQAGEVKVAVLVLEPAHAGNLPAGDLGFVYALARTAAPYFWLARAAESEPRNDPAGAKDLVGISPPMERVRELARLAAQVDLPLLLEGETGTGKELLARYVHAQSPRREKPYIAVNCAAIPEGLFESEFFGHAKGAFTNAFAPHQGLMMEADGGVLFLDEVGELSLPNQARVLRAIETGTFRPVGGKADCRANFRLISASNRSLLDLVRQDQFRADLYFRLCGMEIRLPPLRERLEDIPELVRHFAREYAQEYAQEYTQECAQKPTAPAVRTISAKEIEFLCMRPLPGNVRELRNLVRRMLTLPPALFETEIADRAPVSAAGQAFQDLEGMEREHIRQMLERCGGHLAHTAEALGIHRNTLRRKIQQYQL